MNSLPAWLNFYLFNNTPQNVYLNKMLCSCLKFRLENEKVSRLIEISLQAPVYMHEILREPKYVRVGEYANNNRK